MAEEADVGASEDDQEEEFATDEDVEEFPEENAMEEEVF